ncbi:MAG: TonB-dependent receptor [Gammaproteobacteria bacterium]
MTTRTIPALIAAAVVAPVPVWSQSQDALEEVVVTARKRDESLHDVPVAVNAFSAAEIESAGIQRPQDFIQLTPNMTMVQTQNQGTSFITVRGISQARNSEPSVAVLIDGVAMANPSAFNQELFDVEHIEVLKGPQGALYGRNAIGGAIIIRTQEPGDEFAGKVTLGYDSGPGFKVRGSVGGPINDSKTLKYMVSGSYFKTDGYLDNDYLHREADPFRDTSGRVKLLWEPSEALKTDLRVYYSEVKTQALYFNITQDVNDVSLPIRVNNAGVDERNLKGASLKVDFETGIGSLTSITAFDHVDELLTGDQFDFLPIQQSVLFKLFGSDQAQHQFLDVDAWSQEVRLASTIGEKLRTIVGAYFIKTDRFISTGNVFDLGTGDVPRVERTPLPIFNPQFTFLADSQNNDAWAVFADATYDFTSKLQGDVSLRYDEDHRENTTRTPLAFIPAPLAGLAFPGQLRTKTWDDLQPKVTLRFQPNDTWNLYGGYSRGFRSGGFNQTGVGSAGIAGIGDLFDQETANTLEVGAKGQFLDRRLTTSLNVFHTEAKGSYFFVFDPNTSTQNLGNLGRVDYDGFEFELSARPAEGFETYLRFGYTESEIKESSRAPTDVGNEAPLVSQYTVNLGTQYRKPFGSSGFTGVFRADLERIGPTYWYPDNFTRRRPIDLLNLRLGLEQGPWSLTAWGRNLFNIRYNAEWSPGPQFFPNPGYSNNFVFKAQPRVWGVDFNYRF